MRSALRWTQSNGGPLVLMDERLLPQWSGASNLSDPCDPSTDYGRACLVRDPIGEVPLPGGHSALVLGDDPTLPAALVTMNDGVLILRTFSPETAHEPANLLDVVRSMRDTGALSFRVGPSGVLHLFDAAFPGVEAGLGPGATEERLPELVVQVQPGTYGVHTFVSQDPAGEDTLVHALVRKSDT